MSINLVLSYFAYNSHLSTQKKKHLRYYIQACNTQAQRERFLSFKQLIQAQPSLINFSLISICQFYNNYSQSPSNPLMNNDSPNALSSLKLDRLRYKNKKKNRQKKQTEAPYSQAVYQKFLHILNKRRENFLRSHLSEYYGKNFAISYKQHYGFEEQWQNKRNFDSKRRDNYIDQSNILEIATSLCIIIVYFVTVWLTTIDFFFKEDGRIVFYFITYALTIITTLINLAQRIYNLPTDADSPTSILEIVRAQFFPLTVLLYCTLKLAGINNCTNIFWLVFQSFALILLYKQASQRYQSFRLMSFSLQYEYQTKVFDMIMTIFIIAHFIAILLFSVAKVYPQSNWMTSLNIDPSRYFILYLYSFYFTTTTILTVGYGDITPKNPLEVFVVTLVQIFGIVMLGYIINQIGYCLSSLRKDREVVEKDLSTVQKLKRHYHMSPNLTFKVRSYLVNGKPNINQLSPEEEKGILIKLNEQIRADLTKQNMLSVVKSSVFYLCRWSSNFQQAIASRLIHALFNPNDVLYQPIGKERIYIIKSGKVNIQITRSINKNRLSNVLKAITNTIDKQISDNCYGYTAVISTRPAKLQAISKDFTTAYYIQKQKFLEAVNDKIPDIQFYHEIKCRIDQARFCESLQVPSLESSKHHYHPTKYYIIRKHCNGDSYSSSRRPCLRRNSQAYRNRKPIFSEDMADQIKRCFYGSFASSYDTNFYEETQAILKQSATKQIDDNEDFCKFIMENDLSFNFHHYFQSGKEYSNFFSRSNKSQILRTFQNEHYMKFSKQMQNKYFMQSNELE